MALGWQIHSVVPPFSDTLRDLRNDFYVQGHESWDRRISFETGQAVFDLHGDTFQAFNRPLQVRCRLACTRIPSYTPRLQPVPH